MKKPFRSALVPAAILAAALAASAETFELDPAGCVIVTPVAPADERAALVAETAAEELAGHLRRVTGADVARIEEGADLAGRFPFRVGFAPPGGAAAPEREEARWVVTREAAWFHGDDTPGANGTQTAVYDFLERQLGIRWIEPGDAGIAYREQPRLTLQTGEVRWVPQLVFRKIRQSIRKDQPHRPIDAPHTDAFLIPLEEHNARVEDELLWERRMRMGGARPGGSHAFSTWWEKYGATHPDYFAQNRFGKREPVPLAKPDQTAAFVKICPSNPRVAEQLIANWLPYRHLRANVDVGPNDGHNFCECEACRAQDAPRAGEAWDAHLTDRYVHLANAVAREARKHRPDAYAGLYAYLATLYPPRRLTLEPNVVVQLVPYVDPLDLGIVREHFEGWRKAGATRIALRPNYHHKYLATSLPLGIERQMFDVFQLAVSNGCISADYDSATGHWPVAGITDYILAKAMSDPARSFEHWEDHYCQAYGPAADVVRRYFRYWRSALWDARLAPNLVKIATAGRSGDFSRGLLWNLADYYREEDFDPSDAILAEAAALPLNDRQRGHLEQLVLANRHARLVVRALTVRGQDRLLRNRELTAFRRAHRDTLRMSWVRLVGWEARYANDELRLAEKFKDYDLPWLQTGMTWSFRMDPEDRGLAEGWHRLSWEQAEDWERLRVDNFWEHAYRSETEPGLFGRLKGYDGTAWYTSRLATPAELRGRQILAVFGGGGDTVTLYLNGQPAGEHTVPDEASKRKPFPIRIDPVIDWDRPFQTLTVRVENRGGLGGLYDRIWIVSKQ